MEAEVQCPHCFSTDVVYDIISYHYDCEGCSSNFTYRDFLLRGIQGGIMVTANTTATEKEEKKEVEEKEVFNLNEVMPPVKKDYPRPEKITENVEQINS